MRKPAAGHGERDASPAERLVGADESGMAVGQGKPVRSQTGQVPHDSLVRVDRRVKEILARQEVALQQAAPARWQREFAAEPVIVGEVRRRVAAFARAHGASEDAVDDLSLAVSEATTNAVVHAFVGVPPGRVAVIAEPGEGCVLVRVLDDGRGMTPRADSPGLGLGLTLMASTAIRRDIREGPSGRGTEVRMAFAAAGVSDHPKKGKPNGGLDAATRRRRPAKGTL